MSVAPRRSRFSSRSLPRLRSQPIQTPSRSFQRRRRWRSQKRSPPPAARPVPLVELADRGARRARGAPRPRAGSRPPRRTSPTGARTAARRRRWPGNAPPAAGPASSISASSVRSIGMATSVRKLVRHAARELELREAPRAHEPRDEAVDERDREVGSGHEREEREQDERRRGRAGERGRATPAPRGWRASGARSRPDTAASPREPTRAAATAGREAGSSSSSSSRGRPLEIR